MLPDTSLGFAPTENGLNHSGDFNWEFPRKSIKPIFKEAAAEALRNTRGFGYFLGQVTQALVSGRLSAPDTVVLAGLIGFPVSPALLGGFHIEDLNQSPAIVQPAEPEQWGKPTATSTRTPVPTYTPNPTRTPEATPTPQPIEIELPILGKDVKKPSEVAFSQRLNNPVYFRMGPSTSTDHLPQPTGARFIKTGYTSPQSDGTWAEVVMADGTIAYVRNDVLKAEVVDPTYSERIKYAALADVAPVPSRQILISELKQNAAIGGTSEETIRADSTINGFWGETVTSNAPNNPFDGLRRSVAIATNSPDSSNLDSLKGNSIPAHYTDVKVDGSVDVYALTINGEGFMHVTSKKNSSGLLQAESISIESWESLVNNVGLKKARAIASRIDGIDLHIFKTTVNGQTFISSPQGHEAVGLYQKLTNNPLFNDGKQEPVQPTATTTPTAPKLPNATPTVEKVEETPELQISESLIVSQQLLQTLSLKSLTASGKTTWLDVYDGDTTLRDAAKNIFDAGFENIDSSTLPSMESVIAYYSRFPQTKILTAKAAGATIPRPVDTKTNERTTGLGTFGKIDKGSIKTTISMVALADKPIITRIPGTYELVIVIPTVRKEDNLVHLSALTLRPTTSIEGKFYGSATSGVPSVGGALHVAGPTLAILSGLKAGDPIVLDEFTVEGQVIIATRPDIFPRAQYMELLYRLGISTIENIGTFDYK